MILVGSVRAMLGRGRRMFLPVVAENQG